MKRIPLTVLDKKYLIEADWRTANEPVLVDGERCGQTVGDHQHKPESFIRWFIEEILGYAVEDDGENCCPNCGCDERVLDADGEETEEYECGGDADDGLFCENEKWWQFKELDATDEAKAAGQLALFPDEAR